jgi:hypothetical protein
MAEEAGTGQIQRTMMTYFPMFIATLSLATSLFNGYLNNKFVDIIQHNVERVENLKTCKEIIDAYFQVKFRAGVVSANAARAAAGGAAGDTAAGTPTDQIEAANAVNKFGALGTYLANLRDDATRERYTLLTGEIEKSVAQAARTPRGDVDKLFGTADRMFAAMNDDCVKTAKNVAM